MWVKLLNRWPLSTKLKSQLCQAIFFSSCSFCAKSQAAFLTVRKANPESETHMHSLKKCLPQNKCFTLATKRAVPKSKRRLRVTPSHRLVLLLSSHRPRNCCYSFLKEKLLQMTVTTGSCTGVKRTTHTDFSFQPCLLQNSKRSPEK